MKQLFSFVLLAVFCTAAPVRPLLPEAFQATAQLLIKIETGPYVAGKASFAFNQPNGLGMEKIEVPKLPFLNSYFIQRYDLNSTYELDGDAPQTCVSSSIEQSMPSIWRWVSEAQYKGQENSFGVIADLWELDKGFASMSVAVHLNNSNIPLWVRKITPTQEYNVIFANFNSLAPPSNVFDIPTICKSPQTHSIPKIPDNVECLARATMISRAQVWVNNKVPYNQQGYYDGYREDCSGYVSMAWGLNKPGLTTFTLGTVSHKISKDDLQPGDILLNSAEHVVLFGGWTDSAKTHYVAFEETRPGEGTVKRTTPYPYWYDTNLFLPYRYNAVC